MAKQKPMLLSELLISSREEILKRWLEELREVVSQQGGVLTQLEISREAERFFDLVLKALRGGNIEDLDTPEWVEVVGFLAELSKSRNLLGFTPSETAVFVFSLKKPLFQLIQNKLSGDMDALMAANWRVNLLVDNLGLKTSNLYQQSRETIIERQRAEMMSLSTPVIRLWDDILALPLVGSLDNERTRVVMEELLSRIAETGEGYVIIDITGVPTVDTQVAQNLLKTVAGAKLMGTQCIISGIRPQIAQTMIHLGAGFGDITTKATLSDALAFAFKMTGRYVGTRE